MFFDTLYYALSFQVLIVCLLDIKKRKISNYWVLFNIIVYSLLALTKRIPFVPNVICYALVTLIAGFFLYRVRLVGAGDVKYFFSLILFIPEIMIERFYKEFFLICFIYSFVYIFLKYRSNTLYLFQGKKLEKSPFGPIIFLSWILMARYMVF